MCILCFTVSWCDFFFFPSLSLFFKPNFSEHYLFTLFHFASPLSILPLWLPITSSLHLDLLFSLSPTHSPVFLSTLPFLITFIFPLHHLTPFIPHRLSHPFISPLFFSSPSVFCVSRTLMVTQIFWLLAVPWGWDAVSALHLEVLYNLHTESFNQNCCTKTSICTGSYCAEAVPRT